MDIKIVGEEVIKEQEVTRDPETISGPIREDLEIKAMLDVLGLEEKERTQYNDKLQTILEYAKMKSTDHSFEGLKWAVRNLGLKLGTPDIGEKLVNYLHRYAYLELEGMKIEKEKQKFHDNN